MKKLIALSLVTLMAVGAIAQDASKLRFGLRGGVNLTEMTLKHSDFDTENRMGFFVGPTVKLALPVVGLGLDLSALYNYKESELEGETVKQRSSQIRSGCFLQVGTVCFKDCLLVFLQHTGQGGQRLVPFIIGRNGNSIKSVPRT